MREVPCPECGGSRLRPATLAVKVGGKNITRSRRSHRDSARFFASSTCRSATGSLPICDASRSLRLAAQRARRRPAHGSRADVERTSALVDLFEDRSAMIRSRSDRSSSAKNGPSPDGERRDLVDVLPADFDRQRCRAEPGAAALGAGHLPHVASICSRVRSLSASEWRRSSQGMTPSCGWSRSGPGRSGCGTGQHLACRPCRRADLAVGGLELLPRRGRGDRRCRPPPRGRAEVSPGTRPGGDGPPSIDSSSSPTTSSGSTSNRVPSPSQRSQARRAS